MPLLGSHISVAGGVEKAPARAHKEGCEVMQVFVQSPQTFKTPQTTNDEVENFGIALKKYAIKEVYVHAPYLINLASANNNIKYGSISLIRKNLERASALGCTFVMTHLGSYGDKSREDGLEQVIKSLKKILEWYTEKAKLLLELSAGSGNIIGSHFEEFHKILTNLKNPEVGVCLDTAHIFASGYDLRGKKAIDATISEFETVIGLKNLKLIHLNDSLVPFGSKKDRHTDIGDGEIGIDNISLILNHTKLKSVPMVLETPGNETRRTKDIALLKKLRRS
jgi:deoxyribonuclease-4